MRVPVESMFHGNCMGIAKLRSNDGAKKEKEATSKCINIAYFRATKLLNFILCNLAHWHKGHLLCVTNTRGRHSLGVLEAPTHLNIWPSPLDAPWPASVVLPTSWGLEREQGGKKTTTRDVWAMRHDGNLLRGQVHFAVWHWMSRDLRQSGSLFTGLWLLNASVSGTPTTLADASRRRNYPTAPQGIRNWSISGFKSESWFRTSCIGQVCVCRTGNLTPGICLFSISLLRFKIKKKQQLGK